MMTPSPSDALMPTPRVKEPNNARRVALAKEIGLSSFKRKPQGWKGYFMDGLVDWLNFHNLIPTPMAASAAQGSVVGKSTSYYLTGTGTPRKVTRNGVNASVGLARLMTLGAAGLLPTPIATDWKNGTSTNSSGAPRTSALAPLMRHIAEKGTEGLPERQMPLAELLLTPTASDWKRAGMPGKTLIAHKHKNAEKSNLAERIAHKTGGGAFHLNPLFVEEMMGFPKGWTIYPFLTDDGEQRQ